MGANVKQAEKIEEVKPANGTSVDSTEKQPEEIVTEEKLETTGGCCQGANGFACCRDESVDNKAVKKEVGGLSCWTGKWEQRHVLTAAAVVGAVATVTVAYGVYRRSR